MVCTVVSFPVFVLEDPLLLSNRILPAVEEMQLSSIHCVPLGFRRDRIRDASAGSADQLGGKQLHTGSFSKPNV